MAELLLSVEYNRRDFHPPMPLLHIGLSRPNVRTPQVFTNAILDTGADNTILPLHFVESVNAPFIDRQYLSGITGERELVDIFAVTVYLRDLPVFGVRAAVYPTGHAIIGRDVLNHLQVCLIGPALTTEVMR